MSMFLDFNPSVELSVNGKKGREIREISTAGSIGLAERGRPTCVTSGVLDLGETGEAF